MLTMGDVENRGGRIKVTGTWGKGAGHIEIRAAAIVEDAALMIFDAWDCACAALLMSKDPELLGGMQGAIAALGIPAEHSYEGPGQSDSDARCVVSSKMPDEPEFTHAIERLCEWGSQELEEYGDERVRFVRMMIREFRAPR
eukprot:4583099-Pyramimonas_sp.AAC.1